MTHLVSPSPLPSTGTPAPTASSPVAPRRLQDLLDKAPQAPPPRALQICTYNIQDGRNSRLEMALRNLTIQHIDIAILTELRIPASAPIHTRCSQGYSVYATYTTTTNQGGIALVFRLPEPDVPLGWSIESIRRHGPNVLSCYVMIGCKRQPLIGAYLPPSHLDDIPFLTEALDRFANHRHPPILMGDLNVNLSASNTSSDPRLSLVSDTLAAYGLFDMLPHFRQRRPYLDLCTWKQQRNSQLYKSRCDYILGSDRRLFRTVSIRDPRHFSTDHYMVVATFLEKPARTNHNQYLRGRKRFPLSLPKWGPLSFPDTLFQQAMSNSDKPEQNPYRKRPTWISPTTLQLMDQRCSFRRNPTHDRTIARQLTRQINANLKLDRKQRTEEAGAAIQSTLNSKEPERLRDAYKILQRWYRTMATDLLNLLDRTYRRYPKTSRNFMQQLRHMVTPFPFMSSLLMLTILSQMRMRLLMPSHASTMPVQRGLLKSELRTSKNGLSSPAQGNPLMVRASLHALPNGTLLSP